MSENQTEGKSRATRRLAAILAADVVNFSSLMETDEQATLDRLKDHRQALFDPTIALHHGRIVKLMGDGALVEFGSAVDAVQCAVSIQRGMAERNADVPDNLQIVFRIGINIGDVIVEGDDLYGDGVNIAARLESLAEPGGIDISAKVHDEVVDKLDLDFDDLGVRSLKNIARSIRVFSVRREPNAAASADGTGHRTTLSEKPSIVVLAFDNMSRDPEQDYFADGIAEDIITDLSKLSGLFVIARNTAFSFKGKVLDLARISRELGVRHVLEGSVRKAGNRVRINAQLIDGRTGGHLWAERYDRELTDIFDVQDEVTREIVAALKVHLTLDERQRFATRQTDNVEAHDRFLRGRQILWDYSRESTAKAQKLFQEAIELDPTFAAAQAFLALSHALQSLNRWSPDAEQSFEQAQKLVERALAVDPNEPEAHYVQAVIHLWERNNFDRAIAANRQALALDPNFARAYGNLGIILHYAGRSAEALEPLAKMTRLDPHVPAMYDHFEAQVYFALGQFEKAVGKLKKRLAAQPHSDASRVLLAACYGELGRVEEARAEWKEALRINPDYSIDDRRKTLPYKNPADFERVVDGLRKAGIPV